MCRLNNGIKLPDFLLLSIDYIAYCHPELVEGAYCPSDRVIRAGLLNPGLSTSVHLSSFDPAFPFNLLAGKCIRIKSL
jgi:hypothetical protein